MPRPEITGLLLAAGRSHRFAGHKLLYELHQQPIILYSARALSACDRVLAVVREDDLDLQQLLSATAIEWVANPLAHQGMGTSIACGVAASEDSGGWCLLPADMPWVKPSISQQVVTALRQGARISAPFIHGRRGHPVGFSRLFRPQLIALAGDTGARHIVEQHLQDITRIDCEDAGILRDIDSPQDLLHPALVGG